MPRWIPQRSRSSFIFRPGFAHLQDEMTKGLSLPMKMGREIASFHAELRGEQTRGARHQDASSSDQAVSIGVFQGWCLVSRAFRLRKSNKWVAGSLV